MRWGSLDHGTPDLSDFWPMGIGILGSAGDLISWYSGRGDWSTKQYLGDSQFFRVHPTVHGNSYLRPLGTFRSTLESTWDLKSNVSKENTNFQVAMMPRLPFTIQSQSNAAWNQNIHKHLFHGRNRMDLAKVH